MKFVHAMIRVQNLEKSMEFYTGLLEMNKTGEVKLDDCTLYYLSDEDGQTQLELTYNNETPDGGYANGNAFGHFAFETDKMNDFTERMNKYGYKYLYEPFDLNGKGSKIAFVKDPDGYEIELIEKVVW